MAPADGGGNSSDGAPMGAGKAELTNPSRFKEPGACQQRIIVTPKPGKKKKKKIKRTPPEAVDVGSSTSTVTTKSSSPHDSEEEWQPSSLPGDGEAQQQGPWKRPRLVWTTEMHDKFVEAHTTLGKDAVPKKILELMNDPRLTRDNVASHLQKYRLSLQRSGQPVGTRKRGNATVTRIHHRAQPLQSAPPKAPSTALHRPPQGPCFATPSMSQQQQIGHGQLVQTPPNNLYSGNAPNLLHQYLNLPVDRPKLLHQHMNLPVAQPMPMQDRFNTAMLRATTATKHMLVTDQQAQQTARMKQAAAAASGYNRMPVRNYPWDAQMETRAPVASGLLINHRREPLTQAFKATNVIREYSFPEVNVGDERTERGTVRQQVGVKAETGQERAALPPAAAPADPDRSHQDEPMDDVEQYLNSEPPWG